MSVAEGTEVHVTKFGFVPCDYEFFSKVKFCKKFYWAFVQKQYANDRYHAKLERNRLGNEPATLEAPFAKRCYRAKDQNWYKDLGMNDLFDRVRTPVETMEAVKPLTSSEKILVESLYTLAKEAGLE